MSIEFENAILAGVTLIREAIQSQNYEAGAAGWQIASDGAAEFSDLTIRSSDGSGSTVLVANGSIRVLNGSGSVVVELDATGYRLYDDGGDIVAEIKLDGGGARGGFYTRNFAAASGVYAFLSGGQVTSGPVDTERADSHGFLQYGVAPFASSPYAVQTLSTGAIDDDLDDPARLQLISERGQRPMVWVDGGSAADAADLLVTGAMEVGDTNWGTYTPTVINGGSATYGTRDGWFTRVGKLVTFEAYFTVSAAGSGSGNVMFTLPSEPWRGSGNRRQMIPGTVRDGGVATPGPLAALLFAGGSGTTVDRIQNSAGQDVIGSMLTTNSIWTIQGSYREA